MIPNGLDWGGCMLGGIKAKFETPSLSSESYSLIDKVIRMEAT